MFDVLKELQNKGGANVDKGAMMKQAQDMQATMAESVKKTKEKLQNTKYEGYSNDESVR